MCEHSAHLAVLAFGEAHLDPAIAAGPPLQVRVDRSVAHPLDGDSFGELFELVLRHSAVRPRPVGADHAGPRQLELSLQLAVIGEQQQALGHEIEPANRHQPWKAGRKPIVDCRPSLRIVGRGERAWRLVEAEQPRRSGRPEPASHRR